MNVRLSERGRAAIAAVQAELERHFGRAIWSTPSSSLHISITDWLSPTVDYGKDKDELYKEVASAYTKALEEVTAPIKPFTITFDTLAVSADAVIVKGHDNGSIQMIREQFLNKAATLPGTKTPVVSFIHTTICRFTDKIAFAAVERALARQRIYFEEVVRELLVSRETRLFTQGDEAVKRFPLGR